MLEEIILPNQIPLELNKDDTYSNVEIGKAN
jgi:hypothetical protein